VNVHVDSDEITVSKLSSGNGRSVASARRRSTSLPSVAAWSRAAEHRLLAEVDAREFDVVRKIAEVDTGPAGHVEHAPVRAGEQLFAIPASEQPVERFEPGERRRHVLVHRLDLFGLFRGPVASVGGHGRRYVREQLKPRGRWRLLTDGVEGTERTGPLIEPFDRSVAGVDVTVHVRSDGSSNEIRLN